MLNESVYAYGAELATVGIIEFVTQLEEIFY